MVLAALTRAYANIKPSVSSVSGEIITVEPITAPVIVKVSILDAPAAMEGRFLATVSLMI